MTARLRLLRHRSCRAANRHVLGRTVPRESGAQYGMATARWGRRRAPEGCSNCLSRQPGEPFTRPAEARRPDNRWSSKPRRNTSRVSDPQVGA